MDDGAAVGERALLEGEPVPVGRYAPYPVWIGMTLLGRGAQLVFFILCIWYLAALIDAFEKPHTVPLPPMWLWVASGIIGGGTGRRGRWMITPVADQIGDALASRQCPACGQNVFNHSSPQGYTSPQQQRIYPCRTCANCGHDLRRRTAEPG
jgi:hypothetical protein